MALKLHTTGADEYGQFLKVMIAGDPGAGKTRSASTWDAPLIASLGANLMSVADRQVNYVPIESSADLADLRILLTNTPEDRERAFGFPVNTIIIDTLDHFQEVLVAERKAAHKIEEFTPTDWGWLNDEMAAVVRGFRNLPLHVVFHLHLKLTEDMLTGQVYFRPSLQGQMGDKIAAYVDIALAFKGSATVAEDGARTLHRWAQTYSDDQHPWIRDNSGKLPPEFEINFADDFARLRDAVYQGVQLPASQAGRELNANAIALARNERIQAGLADAIPGSPTAADLAAAQAKGAKPAARQVADEEAARKGKTKEELAATPDKGHPQPSSMGVGTAVPPAEAEAEAALVAELTESNGQPPLEEMAASATTTEMVPCAECGGVIESEDQLELSTVRFRRPMCRNCFKNSKRDLSASRS